MKSAVKLSEATIISTETIKDVPASIEQKKSDDRASHLYNVRETFSDLLEASQEHQHMELARKHGWALIDIKCDCGLEIKDYPVDIRSSIGDDLRVKPCKKCGARGAWQYQIIQKSSIPKSEKPKPSGKKIS